MEMLVGNTVLVVLVGLHVHHALYQVDNGYTEEIIGDSAKKESETFPLRMMETSKGPSSSDPVCLANVVPPSPNSMLGKALR